MNDLPCLDPAYRTQRALDEAVEDTLPDPEVRETDWADHMPMERRELLEQAQVTQW